MGINKTGMRSLDNLAADPRILEVWDEGRDGLWASLAPEYNSEGCSALHAATATELVGRLWTIEPGEPY